ncbi:glycosyltransferase family 2 protein [Phosphitispora fastidiosa]|uniref:glycosyltransferase family 2 protein n=1 Tax=Phosphitispora fastidiosa TaxID=2837202 RepID=UPI001E31CCBD|nr:glycosyltransferase [Phosphitispora fastidiosa]MBU7008191.1 glycosyltransferase involved in cell wall biosynthesis [Phosphitispora fastidiosa]
MSKQPLVSIVLPTYNGERYLAQSIESCLSQTYLNWELIIVDDASTDNTPNIILRYVNSDTRIFYKKHNTNRKLPAALNTGFKTARGTYLTWTSDDNCYCREAIATMVEYLECNPNTDMVYADYNIIDDRSNMLEYVRVGMPEDLWKANCVGACFLYKRIIYDKLGGYAEELFLAEDYDYWLRASIAFKLEPLHQLLYLYRVHGSSLTSKERKGSILLATEKTLRHHLLHNSIPPVLIAKGYFGLANIAKETNERLKGCKYMLLALKNAPGSSINNLVTQERRLLSELLVGKKITHGIFRLYKQFKNDQ